MPDPAIDFADGALIAGGALTAVAAFAHLACIAIGAPAYRFMGAGERMARAAEAGDLKATAVTLAIAAVLFVWAIYAFSGAGVIGQLPFTAFVLPAVSVVFLARAIAFPLLKSRFPENSTAFWMYSSGICLVLGLLYAIGSVHVWSARAGAAGSSLPAWLQDKVADLERLPPGQAPREIVRASYGGRTVYYISARCCDLPSELYEESGKLICFPDGGFAGGDGRCPGFALPPNAVPVWRAAMSPPPLFGASGAR